MSSHYNATLFIKIYLLLFFNKHSFLFKYSPPFLRILEINKPSFIIQYKYLINSDFRV